MPKSTKARRLPPWPLPGSSAHVAASHCGRVRLSARLSVTINYRSQGVAWSGGCNYNDPFITCEAPEPPDPQTDFFFYASSVAVPIYVEGGGIEQMSIPVDFSFPAFLFPGVRAEAGARVEIADVGDIEASFPHETEICFW